MKGYRKGLLVLCLALGSLLVLQGPAEATIFADTDGDGFTDNIDVCQTVKVCIYHPRTGITTVYGDATWNSMSINTAVDTNGQPGAEVVIIATKSGVFDCICIIRDRTQTMVRYKDTNWSSVSINRVVDTDGMAGADVVLIATSSFGTLSCICIIHDPSNTWRSYKDVNWASVSINTAADTDGVAGADVVLTATTSSGQLFCICIIHDPSGTYRSYKDVNWASVGINTVADTDGTVGGEVVLTATTGTGSFWCVCTIVDRSGIWRTYRDVNWGSVGIRTVADTDGVAGGEIVITATTGGGSFWCVCVIRDRTSTYNTYRDPAWGSVSINSVVDTDGQAGGDIIVVYASTSDQGISVIRDRVVSYVKYSYYGKSSFTIQRVADYDGIAGAEICVFWTQFGGGQGYELIIDRTQTRQPRSNC